MSLRRTLRLSTSLLLLQAVAPAALAQEDGAVARPAAQEETQAEDAGVSVAARQAEIDTSAEAALARLFEVEPVAREMFERAAGYAVFTATQAGFIVTGGGGTGVAIDKSSGQRTYMRMGTGGVGLGIGARRYDLVILFESQPYVDRFVQGGWDASATAQAAAGRDGVAFTSSFVDGVAFFQLTDRGLMAQADISGTRFWVADRLN